MRNRGCTGPLTECCFSPRVRSSELWCCHPGACSPSNKPDAAWAFVTFSSPHSATDASLWLWPPRGRRGQRLRAATVSPPPKERLMLCHPLSPPRHQGSHMQYLFLSEGSCFNAEKPGPPLSHSPSPQFPPPSFAPAAAAQVITEPRETRPGLCFPHEAADMFPTVNTFPPDVPKGPVLSLWKQLRTDNRVAGGGKQTPPQPQIPKTNMPLN